MLQCPSSLKQLNFEMECFSSLQSCYKYRSDNLQSKRKTIFFSIELEID